MNFVDFGQRITPDSNLFARFKLKQNDMVKMKKVKNGKLENCKLINETKVDT